MLGDLNFPPEDSSVKYKKMKQIYIYICLPMLKGKMRNKGKNTEGEISKGCERLHCIDEHVTGGTQD